MPFVADEITTSFKPDDATSSFKEDTGKPTSSFQEDLKELPVSTLGVNAALAIVSPNALMQLKNLHPDAKKEIDKSLVQTAVGFGNTITFGIPNYLIKKLGYKLPEPKTPTQQVARGVGDLAGFIGGPISAAGKVVSKTPLIARAMRPATTLTQAVAKPIIRGAATLGTAEGLMTPESGITDLKARGEQFKSGAKTGSIFGILGNIPSKALRMIFTSAYLGVPASLRNEPLEQQIMQYGLGAYFGRHGGTPKQVLAREKPLADLVRTGVNKYEAFLKAGQDSINQEKALTKETGRKPVSKQERLREIIRPKETSALADVAAQTTRGQSKGWKLQTVRSIKQRLAQLKSDPYFQLESGDMQFLSDYIGKDLKGKNSELMKFDNVELKSIATYLQNYRPPADSPFLKPPPLKPLYAGNDWRKKISPWDITLRPGLTKLQKLGFGDYAKEYHEGLTSKFFNSGADKAGNLDRYMKLRNNWTRVTGFDKQRSNDIFDYLDGKSSAKYIEKLHGKKTVAVANQMRSFLDTLLERQNRHRATYGEAPVKARKDYITHLFESLVGDIQAKKHPFPDWLADAMPYITPSKKDSRFLKTRTGAKGFQRDIWKALDAYTYSATQSVGDEPIRRAFQVSKFLEKQIDYEKKTGNISEADWTGIKKNLDDYTADLQGRPGKIDQTLRGLIDPLNAVLKVVPGQPQIKSLNDITDGMVSLIYGSQMAYRPKLLLRNLGQHSLIIGQTGFKPLGWAIKNRSTKEAKDILSHSKLLKSRQRTYGAETQALYGSQALQKVAEVGLRPYRLSDLINVEDAYLAGYKHAKDNPSKYPNPYKRAERVAALSQYIYLAENRSDLARGWRLSKTFGRPLSIFTTWPANYIEFNIASATDENTRKNLLKYWATALTFTAVSSAAGIRGANYVGVNAPLGLAQTITKGKLPVAGVLARPKIQALEELKDFLSGDKSLKDIFFYTQREK